MGSDPAGVYEQLAPAVLGYLRAQGVTDPDDLLGEVFLHVARDLARFGDADDPLAVRRWVFGIARHRVLDARRRAARRPRIVSAAVPELPGAASPSPDGPDPELVAALATLTPEQREVLALRFVADLALGDVAALTGRTVGAVKALQHRALEQLRAAVSPAARPAL
jgi:RNA polymerase sigma-70 factor (ECF subfamily)